MNRMVSIDLNTPTPSLTAVNHSKGHLQNSNETRKFHLKQVGSDTKIYDKYFHIRIAKYVSVLQLIFAVIILISQLCTTGLIIGPVGLDVSSAISTSDRIGLGIWTSVITTLAAGATFWAVNKANFFRLHSSMLLNFASLVGYFILEYLVLVNTIPRIQERIYILQQKTLGDSSLESRRLLLIANSNSRDHNEPLWKMKSQTQMQEIQTAELHRLYGALVFSILMALFGVFQWLLHLFMTLKTGRAICLGKTFFEGKLFQMHTIGRCWRTKSLRLGSKNNSFLDLPKLERSDALPPPPYESGYFQQSLSPSPFKEIS